MDTETTLFIAKVLGAYFIVSGIFVATHKKTFVAMMNDMFKNRAVTFIVGALLVLGGTALVLRGNVWTDPVSIFVALVSWAILLKGVAYVLAPEKLHKIVKSLSKLNFTLVGVTVTAIGIYLVFFLA